MLHPAVHMRHLRIPWHAWMMMTMMMIEWRFISQLSAAQAPAGCSQISDTHPAACLGLN